MLFLRRKHQHNMRIDILTVVPELLESPLSHSIVGRAIAKGIEEIHVHGYLEALTIYIFAIIHLVDDHDLTVCNGSDFIVLSYALTHRHTEEKEYESHEEHRDGAERIRNEGPRYEAHDQVCKRSADQPHEQYRTVTVFMYNHNKK